jgi:hypothetical protein
MISVKDDKIEIDFSDILPNINNSPIINDIKIYFKVLRFPFLFKIVLNKTFKGRCVECDNRNLYCGKWYLPCKCSMTQHYKRRRFLWKQKK